MAQDFQAALRPLRLRPTKGLFANASRVSRCLGRQRPSLGNYRTLAGRDGSSFEQSFQIMVVVLVETSDGEHFLGAPQLAFDITVFRTCHESPVPARGRPTVGVSYESDAVTGSEPLTAPIESAPGTGSAAASQWPDACGSPPTVPAEPAGVTAAARQDVGIVVQRAGERRRARVADLKSNSRALCKRARQVEATKRSFHSSGIRDVVKQNHL